MVTYMVTFLLDGPLCGQGSTLWFVPEEGRVSGASPLALCVSHLEMVFTAEEKNPCHPLPGCGGNEHSKEWPSEVGVKGPG